MSSLSNKVVELVNLHKVVIYVDDSFVGIQDNFGTKQSFIPLLPKAGCLWLAQMMNLARYHQVPIVCLDFHEWPQEEILFIQETIRWPKHNGPKVIGFSSAEEFIVGDGNREHANVVLEQWTRLRSYAKLLQAPIVSSLHDDIILA